MVAVSGLREVMGVVVVVTLGERGMLVSDPEFEYVLGVELSGELDMIGVGDSAMVGCVLGWVSGGTLAEVAVVGNLVAFVTVE